MLGPTIEIQVPPQHITEKEKKTTEHIHRVGEELQLLCFEESYVREGIEIPIGQ
jgi:hypothetical protein